MVRPGVRWRLYVWYLRSIESDDWRAEYGPKYPLIGEVSQRDMSPLNFYLSLLLYFPQSLYAME